MPTKLLIFDLDGTLIDSLPDLTNAVNHALDHFSRPRLPEAEVRKLIGQGARSLVERALAGATVEEIEEGLRLFLDFNLAHIADETRLYPGVVETLETLKGQGLEMCLLSNKNVALCREVLDRMEITGYFSGIFGADSFPFRKPSPEPVLALVDQYGVAAAEAVMIGDSINDIAAGQGAGVVTVGCSYGYGEPWELAEADYLVDDLQALRELFAKSKEKV